MVQRLADDFELPFNGGTQHQIAHIILKRAPGQEAIPEQPAEGAGAALYLNAEWTGGFFDPTGKSFYVSVQHNVTGHGVILEITGWK